MLTQQVVAAGFPDVKEIVSRCDFTKRQNLYAVGCVHEQVADVTQPFSIAHRLTHPVDIAAALRR